jgi:RNA polymerase sigma-70 factor (ECF subfamily)
MKTGLEKIEQMDDLTVIRQTAEGNTALFEILIRRYNPVIYKIGRAYGFDHHTTEDIMQDTYVDAFKNLRNFEGRSSFKTWLTRLMLNNCYHTRQKYSFQNEISGLPLNIDHLMPMFTHPSGTEKSVLNRELAHVVESALNHLPEEYRVVFALRELNEMSIAESAETLHISESNVKVRLNRARKMLQREILNMYSREEVFSFNLVYCDSMVQRTMDAIRALQDAA